MTPEQLLWEGGGADAMADLARAIVSDGEPDGSVTTLEDRILKGLAALIAVQEKALTERDAEVARLRRENQWLNARLKALQDQQRVMRDPERKMVCDILANGRTYEKPLAQPEETP